MTISIGGLGSQPLGQQPRTDLNEANVDRVTSNAANHAGQTAEAATDGETTNLTAGTANLAALNKLAMSDDETRSEKVEKLRQKVAAGNYKPEPSAIADALLSEWE
ncbi:MAG TPA: flagellar biosynthesis anti-sigma factor FlgM [Terriglobales bacterium]|nr:flagellar biosynthesis anti-sigma factor FlgM [Terriglobales bacterium]